MPRRAKPSKTATPSVERLERRDYLSVSTGDGGAVVSWQGRTYEAVPDSYLLEMPAGDSAARSGIGVAAAPVLPESWSIVSVGGGWFELQTSGASVTDVQAWADAQGITSIEPNQVLVKQRYPFDSYQRSLFPTDTWFTQYQWGLNSTGDLAATVSPESAAAARLGNDANIFPRWPVSSGRVDAFGNLQNDADIDAPEAWFKETGSKDVIVVVMDDGVDHSHPDLNRNMWQRDLVAPRQQFSSRASDVDGVVTGFAGPGVIQVSLGPGVALNTVVEIHRDWQRIGAAHVIGDLGGGLYQAQLHAEQAPFLVAGNNDPSTPQHGAAHFQFDIAAIRIGDQATTRRHISRVTGSFGFNSAEFLSNRHFNNPQERFQYIDGGLGIPGLVATQPGDPDMQNSDWDNSWRGANDSHGTHVAGILGAVGSNRTGVTGMAWSTSIYSANIFRYGNYVLSQAEGSPLEDKFRWQGAGGAGAVAAMVDAVDRIIDLKNNFGQNIAVVNMSFNTYNYSQAMFDAVEDLSNAGILVVTAAGNGYDPCRSDGVGDQYSGRCDWQPVYPAVLDLPNIINVTASTAVDRLARFANWGSGVDIAAPGENIWSTVPLSARRYEPGAEALGTDVPIRYDSREPFEPPPLPGQNVPQMDAVVRFGGFTTQPRVVRPLMYRQVPQTLVQYDRVNLIGREGGFSSMSGTSMSAAYVTGTAALVSSFYYTRVGVLPEVAFVRGAILGGADITPTLTYQASSPGKPPFDYQMRNRTQNGVIGSPVAWTGMYIPPNDPANPTHSIPGNLRLNANGALQWCIDRMPPVVLVDSPSTLSRLEGDEWISPTPFRFTYTLQPSKYGPTTLASNVNVTYWTEGLPGQATPGVDFLEIPRGQQFFTIPAGAQAGTQYTFDLPIVIGDSVRELDEQFRIRFAMLPQPNVRPSAYVNPFNNQVTTIIRNDDASDAEPAVRIDDQNPVIVQEGNGGAQTPTVVRIPVTLDRVAARTVLVPYQVTTIMPPGEALSGTPGTPGADFIAQNGTLSIARGQRGGTIAFRVLGNQLDQGDRTLVVRLIEQPNHGVLKLNRTARLANNVFVTIRDDDDPVPPHPQTPSRLLRLSGPANSVAEGDNVVFSVQLDQPVAAGWALTVVYRAESGTAVAGRDFVGVTSKLTLFGGQSSGQITIRTLQDRAAEASETFNLRILSTTYRSLVGRQQGVVSIVGASLAEATIDDRPRTLSGSRSLRAGLFKR
jgi:subtilisin family serine protease